MVILQLRLLASSEEEGRSQIARTEKKSQKASSSLDCRADGLTEKNARPTAHAHCIALQARPCSRRRRLSVLSAIVPCRWPFTSTTPVHEFVRGDVGQAPERAGRRRARSSRGHRLRRGRLAAVASICRPSRLLRPVCRRLRRWRLRRIHRWIWTRFDHSEGLQRLIQQCRVFCQDFCSSLWRPKCGCVLVEKAAWKR